MNPRKKNQHRVNNSYICDYHEQEEAMIAKRCLKATRSVRLFHYNSRLHKNIPKFDDAELMAQKLNRGLYSAKRTENDFDWTEKTDRQKEKDYQDRMEKILKLTAALQGLFLVAGVGAIGTAYMKWPQIKGWWLTKDIKVDDDAIEKLVKNKKKKALSDIPYIPETEPGSDVPGVYYWGERIGDGKVNKFPQRVPWFDNKYLRDITLDSSFKNLAVDERGDLMAWDMKSCETILPDQNLIEVKISNNVAYGLNKKGEILVIPVKDEELRERYTERKRSLLAPWKKYCSYKWKLETKQLFNEKGEKNVTQFSTGREHLVFISNVGKAYTCATGISPLEASKSRGQFGIPTLSQFDPFPKCNQVYEIELLNNVLGSDKVSKRTIEQVECGNYHTLARDSIGQLYSFGLNTYGQLGHPISYDMEYIPFPKKVSNFNAHFTRDNVLKCVDIHCSGDTSYASVIPQDVHKYFREKNANIAEDMDNITYFSFGNGLQGQLGNGHFKHSQPEPTKLKVLNEIKDYITKDKSKRVKIEQWGCGDKHVICKLENNDVLVWGYNENGQLGNGKRIKWCKPSNIPKLLEPGIKYDKNPEELLFNINNRLQLKPEQQLTAGGNASCIYWKR